MNIIKFILLTAILVKSLSAFDGSNNNCPGETIPLPISGPSPFVGNGTLPLGDRYDNYKFTVPISGSVEVKLRTRNGIDYKIGTSCQGHHQHKGPNLIRTDIEATTEPVTCMQNSSNLS